jgi:hypothetical protein
MKFAGQSILDALKATGSRLGRGPDMQVLIVGGAAGLLTGQLRPERTTADVDVLNIEPSKEDQALFDAAAEVGREMGLPNDWLNGEAGLYREALSPRWRDRRVLIGRFGRLTVYAAGRIDLLAMKFYAGRTQDIQDLVDLRPTPRERQTVRRQIARLGGGGKVLRALQRIDHWEM